jgi:hypothetical protein
MKFGCLNALGIVSLVPCVAVAALWGRSYSYRDSWIRGAGRTYSWIGSDRGIIAIHLANARSRQSRLTWHWKCDWIGTSAARAQFRLPPKSGLFRGFQWNDDEQTIALPDWCLMLVTLVAPLVRIRQRCIQHLRALKRRMSRLWLRPSRLAGAMPGMRHSKCGTGGSPVRSRPRDFGAEKTIALASNSVPGRSFSHC